MEQWVDEKKVKWESLLVERPFCQQLEHLGWTWLEGDTDVPELTERQSFRKVLRFLIPIFRN